MNKKTKIVCTMGPATSTVEMMKTLMRNGMDICRLNFSHGTHEAHKAMIDKIKQAREEVAMPIAILLDTKGPEIRTCLLENDEKVFLEKGEQFTLTTRELVGNKSIVQITYDQLPQDLEPGNTVLIDDGLIELTVKEIKDGTDIICEIMNGGYLSNRKGVNVPNVKINLPGITEKDKEDIIFGIEQGIDFIAASFVRNAAAIRDIKEILKAHNAEHIQIISKIENAEGIENLDEIIEESHGIMVARGDLGVEVPAQDVPHLQKMMIKKCRDASKPVITATQMLDSMIRNPRPTRAEVADVANAIYDGTDAIMLSGETAMGSYPLEAVQMMAKIAIETEPRLDYSQILKKNKSLRKKGVSSAVAYSAVNTAAAVNSDLIIASTRSGYTARLVSKLKPEARILGLSRNEQTLRSMQILWGVVPKLADAYETTDEMLLNAEEIAKREHLAKEGDLIILTAGTGSAGVTNMLRVVEIE